MNNNTASASPFKPVIILMKKVKNRYFASKNRKKDLKGYGFLFLDFLNFQKEMNELSREIEKGLVENGILDEPKLTLYLREIEQKIEAITSEKTDNKEFEDLETVDQVVFDVNKMTMEDFKYLSNLQKDKKE